MLINPVSYNLSDLVGNTPIYHIKSLSSKKINVFGKLEGQNIGGSIKDRIASNIIDYAIKTKQLTKEKTILEASSGNTAIGLSMIAASKGYKITVVVSESVSVERKKLLKLLGAKIIFSPSNEGTDGAIRLLKKIYSRNPEKYFLSNQFSNPINPITHYYQTAKEIIYQLPNIDYLVIGIGTSGTAVSLSKALKEYNPKIKIIVIEPKKETPIAGLKNLKISIVPKIYDSSLFDKTIYVSNKETISETKKIIRTEGLMIGISSGAALAGAKKFSRKIKKGNILVILPDRIERYLSIF